MIFTFDSPFKRAIFIAIVIAINIILLFTAFVYQPDLHQKPIIIYLVIIQFLILATFFIFRNYTTAKVTQVKKLKNPRLQENAFEISKLMLKEYDYIQKTAHQAMEDRHTMINFFLIITGAVISIIGSKFLSLDLQVISTTKISFLIALALFLNIIGWIYFMHLIRLRQAWWGSAEAMNQIKEFFIINGRVPDDIARTAFLWEKRTIPRTGKKSNVFYYSTMLLSFVASTVLLFASWFLGYSYGIHNITMFTVIIAVYHFIFQMLCYSLFLDYQAVR